MIGGLHQFENIRLAALERTAAFDLHRRHSCREPTGLVDARAFSPLIEIACHVSVAGTSRVDRFFRDIGRDLVEGLSIVNDRSHTAESEKHFLNAPLIQGFASLADAAVTGQDLHLMLVGFQEMDMFQEFSFPGPIDGEDILAPNLAQITLRVDRYQSLVGQVTNHFQ